MKLSALRQSIRSQAEDHPLLAMAIAVTFFAGVYLLVMYALVPSMVAGSIPLLSPAAARYGYDVATFQDFVERVFPAVGWVLALLAFALVGKGDSPWRRVAILIVVATVTVLTLNAIDGPVRYRGDANDYYLTGISIANHLTPELRAADVEEYSELRLRAGIVSQSPYDGYFKSQRNSRDYSWHFWLYPLAAAPLHLVLDAIGALPLRAFELLNVTMYALATWAIIRTARLTDPQKAMFVGLLTFSPLIWYASWPSAEVFAASLVVIGIAFAIDRKWVASVLCIALATTTNPSLLPITAALTLYSLWVERASLDVRKTVAIGAAAAVALGASAFYYVLFGTTNLIQGAGMASFDYSSPFKVLDFFVSLDQGVLPYAPVALVAAVAATAYAIVRRDAWTGLRVAALLACVTLTTTTIEWNSDAAGMRRHALWLLPVLIWLGIELLPRLRRGTTILYALLGAQLLITAAWIYPPVMSSHSPLCEFVLDSAPQRYSPLPDVFAARTTHIAEPIGLELPVCYCCDGDVTKLLVDSDHLDELSDYLVLQPEAHAAIAEAEPTAGGLYYVTPPQGSARLREQEAAVEGGPFPAKVALGGPSQYGRQFDRFNVIGVGDKGLPEVAPRASYALHVTVTNTSTQTWYPGGTSPIGLRVDVGGSSPESFGPIPLIRAVRPGEDADFYAHFVSPESPGKFEVRATLIQTAAGSVRSLTAPSEPFGLIVDYAPVSTVTTL